MLLSFWLCVPSTIQELHVCIGFTCMPKRSFCTWQCIPLKVLFLLIMVSNINMPDKRYAWYDWYHKQWTKESPCLISLKTLLLHSTWPQNNLVNTPKSVWDIQFMSTTSYVGEPHETQKWYHVIEKKKKQTNKSKFTFTAI